MITAKKFSLEGIEELWRKFWPGVWGQAPGGHWAQAGNSHDANIQE